MLMQWDCQMVIVNAGYRDVDGQNQTNPETQSTWLSMKWTAEKFEEVKKNSILKHKKMGQLCIEHLLFTYMAAT